MKKSKKIVITIIAIIAILASFIGGQVYAKYMSPVTGNGTAEIANWSFKVNDNSEKMQTISLVSTVDNGTLVGNKIAPGTAGNICINIDATGADVGVNYAIKFRNETPRPRNLIFEYKGISYNSLEEIESDLVGTINANDEQKVKKIVITWKWLYESGQTDEGIIRYDGMDTEDSKIGSYTFDVVVSGTQVTPTK